MTGAVARARGILGIFQDGLQDLLGEADGLDGTLPRDGLSVCGNAHTVVGIAEHTVNSDECTTGDYRQPSGIHSGVFGGARLCGNIVLLG